MNLHWFFVASSLFLLYIAAGLFSRQIILFEKYSFSKLTQVADADEQGSLYPTVNPRHLVWYFPKYDPESSGNGGWSIFEALFGWSHEATVGSIIGYCLFWAGVIFFVGVLWIKDGKHKYSDPRTGRDSNVRLEEEMNMNGRKKATLESS